MLSKKENASAGVPTHTFFPLMNIYQKCLGNVGEIADEHVKKHVAKISEEKLYDGVNSVSQSRLML